MLPYSRLPEPARPSGIRDCLLEAADAPLDPLRRRPCLRAVVSQCLRAAFARGSLVCAWPCGVATGLESRPSRDGRDGPRPPVRPTLGSTPGSPVSGTWLTSIWLQLARFRRVGAENASCQSSVRAGKAACQSSVRAGNAACQSSVRAGKAACQSSVRAEKAVAPLTPISPHRSCSRTTSARSVRGPLLSWPPVCPPPPPSAPPLLPSALPH